MDDSSAEAIKINLDRQLAAVGDQVGIAFGTKIFDDFRRRGWITLETFGILGTTLFATKLPAHQKTHYVFATWDIPEYDFKVGSDANRT